MSLHGKPGWLIEPRALQNMLSHGEFEPSSFEAFTTLQDSSLLSQGVRQFVYWREQLLPSITPQTIYLAFLGPRGLAQPNVHNVYKDLSSICDMGQLLEVQTGANTNFIALSFKTSLITEKIVSSYHYSGDNIVLCIASTTAISHRFRLLWLPPLFSIARVHHLLNSITKSHRLKRETMYFNGSVSTDTNVVSGTLSLQDGQSVDDLPYMIRLPAPHRGCALLLVRNRRPICLKCRALGHTRHSCTMIKCSVCGKVHFPGAPCGTSSYSAVASRNVTSYADDNWLDLIPDNAVDANADVEVQGSDGGSFTILSSDGISPPLSSIAATGSEDLRILGHSGLSQSLALGDVAILSGAPSECDGTREISSGLAALDKDSCSSYLASSDSLAQHSDLTFERVATYSSGKHPPKAKQASLHIASVHSVCGVSSAKSPSSSHADSLFGDPDVRECFLSSANSSSGSDNDMEAGTDLQPDPGGICSSRKRKASSSDSVSNSGVTVTPISSGSDPIPQSDLSSDPALLDECLRDCSQLLLFNKSTSVEEFSDKLHSLLNFSDEQYVKVLSHCPGGVMSLAIAQTLVILNYYDVRYDTFILSPDVLSMAVEDLLEWIAEWQEQNTSILGEGTGRGGEGV